MTDLSVIIVTRNTCALTSEAIRSVLESHDDLRKEMFVVDNGSTDETPNTLPRQFPELTYLRSKTNLGFARANNLAAQQANGEFLLLLNSDARLQPEALGTAAEWMRGHPDCGVCGAQLLNPDGSRQNSIANHPSLATELLNKSVLRWLFPKRYPGKEQPFSEPTPVPSVVGAFMLVRACLWRELGGLDERYFFFLEETDFCLQAQRKGWTVVHLPQVRVWHGQGKTAQQVAAGARIEYWRSRYAYFAKNHSRLTGKLLRTGLLFRLTANCLSSGLMTAATLGLNPRWRKKWELNAALWNWHCHGCPQEAGLPR